MMLDAGIPTRWARIGASGRDFIDGGRSSRPLADSSSGVHDRFGICDVSEQEKTVRRGHSSGRPVAKRSTLSIPRPSLSASLG